MRWTWIFWMLWISQMAIGSPCTVTLSWQELLTKLTDSIQTDRLTTPTSETLCFPNTPPPSTEDGTQIYTYLWLHTKYSQIAKALQQRLSPYQETLATFLMQTCEKYFPKTCAAPIRHRMSLLEQYPATSIVW